MADRGFTVHGELACVCVSLNIPAFLSGRDYLTKAEVKAIKLSLPSTYMFKWQLRESKLTVSFEMKNHWHFTGQSTKFGYVSVYWLT